MLDKNELKKHAARLEKHINEYGGGHSASSLMHEADRHDEVGQDARDNNDIIKARKHHNKAADLMEASNDVHAAHEAVKSYGQGHNMKTHGEGKPYGDK